MFFLQRVMLFLILRVFIKLCLFFMFIYLFFMYDLGLKYSFREVFITLGVHAGHSRLNSILECGWFVYGFRQNIVLINIDKSVWSFKRGFGIATAVSSIDQPFWFVNQNFSFRRYIKALALKCGEYSSTELWIRGMASNYRYVSLGYFRQQISSGFPKTSKNRRFELCFSNWLFSRFVKPLAVFVSSVFSNQLAVKDSLDGKVPCIGILDTNARAGFCLLPIPANDDSIDCMVFYNVVFSELLLQKKFNILIFWFYYIKNFSRKILMKSWIFKKLTLNFGSLTSFFSLSLRNRSSFNMVALTFLNGLNSWFGHVTTFLSVSYNKPFSISFFKNVLNYSFNKFIVLSSYSFDYGVFYSFEILFLPKKTKAKNLEIYNYYDYFNYYDSFYHKLLPYKRAKFFFKKVSLYFFKVNFFFSFSFFLTFFPMHMFCYIFFKFFKFFFFFLTTFVFQFFRFFRKIRNFFFKKIPFYSRSFSILYNIKRRRRFFRLSNFFFFKVFLGVSFFKPRVVNKKFYFFSNTKLNFSNFFFFKGFFLSINVKEKVIPFLKKSSFFFFKKIL